VVEVVEQVVREELLGGAELAAGWGTIRAGYHRQGAHEGR
jgi:hypothetical protein